METLPSILLATFIMKALDFLKLLRNKDWNAVVTQLSAWGAGIGGIFLFSETAFAADLRIGDHSLASADGATKLLAGFLISSIASVVYDFKRSVDASDSAKMPPLTTL